MYFESFSEVLAMGGHGFYVWLAYGVSTLAIVYLLLGPILRKRQLLAEVRRQVNLQQVRESQASQPNQENV